MKFTFKEGDFTGAYRFGGKLEISAETAPEVESLISHFRLFSDTANVETLESRIAALKSGKLSHTIGTEKRPVYGVESCLDFDFTAPYKQWAKRNFGFTGIFPDLEISRKWGGLIYTNYQSRLYTHHEHICFETFVTSEPWANKDAQSYAEHRAWDCIAEEFGNRYSEPEFVQGRNNHFTRNPDYLKRHRPTPMASNARLKSAFFAWWLERHASDAQREIVQGNRDIAAQTGSYMSAFDFARHETVIYYEHTGKDYKSISFPDFAALANKESK